MMDEIAAEAASNDELTWNDLTVPQLKEELTMRSLETTGKKADLVARLEQYDKEMAAQQKQEEENVDNGDEFVVWNVEDEAEPDAELASDGAKKDEEKAEDEDGSAPVKDVKAGGDASKTETNKPTKEIEKEFTVTPSKDKDLLYLMFAGKKIIVPFKDEILRDLKHVNKQLNIIMYPVQVVDLYSDTFRPLIEKAINVSTELDETLPGNPIKGYLRLKFGSVDEATRAVEILKEYRRDEQELTIKYFADDDSEGHVLSKIKKEDAERKGPIITRLVYVGNLPNDVTEEAIKSCFVDAVRVILPSKEDSSEKLGHAYLEYSSEDDAKAAAEKYHDVKLAEQKLYVIKSMTARAESFGLLKDGLRMYWLDQIHQLETSKAKLKSSRDIEAVDVKLLRMKRRIKNDNDKRVLMALPVPDEEKMEVPEGDEEEEKEKVKDEKPAERSASSHGHSKSTDRPRTPPRHRFSPPPYRGRVISSSRGYRGGPSGSYGRGGVGADRIVDQIQELVGALAQRERSSDYGSGGYRGRGGYYDTSSRGSRGGYGSGDYRGSYRGSDGRFGGKRPGEDYGGDRKRHESDSYYRGGFSSYGGGSRRGGGSSYY